MMRRRSRCFVLQPGRTTTYCALALFLRRRFGNAFTCRLERRSTVWTGLLALLLLLPPAGVEIVDDVLQRVLMLLEDRV